MARTCLTTVPFTQVIVCFCAAGWCTVVVVVVGAAGTLAKLITGEEPAEPPFAITWTP